jgi:glycosyltransferase involved in cell wall biosynthesis
LDDWVYIGQKNKVKPIVVHAPTKADIKGTSHVLNAIDNLKKEGLDFEFRLIQGLSNKEAQEAYKEADIIIDQLRIGWYGVLSVEAMALGKAVICYIRDDLIEENFPLTNRPFCIANPDTIIDNLRELILSPKLRQDYAEKGYEYCRNVHDSDKIALQYIDLYEKARKEPKPINLGEVFDFIEWQENLIASDTDNLVAQIRKKMGTI